MADSLEYVLEETQREELMDETQVPRGDELLAPMDETQVGRSEARARIIQLCALLSSMAQDAARWAMVPGVANRRSIETFQVKTVLLMSSIDATDIYRLEDPQGVLGHYARQVSDIRRDWHALCPKSQELKKEDTKTQMLKNEDAKSQELKKEDIESQELKKEDAESDPTPAKKHCKREGDNWDDME